MTPDFWRTIDLTRPERRNPAEHGAALTEHLTGEGVAETLRFAATFDRALDSLCSWELWGAAHLALGGCSDDAFEYVRAWIIGEGDVAWTLAASDPEALFLHLLAGAEAPAERWHELAFDAGEHLLHAAGRAHERLTGERLPASNRARSAEPRGVEWEERDLPHIFGDLAAALPDSWFHTDDVAPSPDVEVMLRTERGITAFLDGDHAAAREAVEALVADPSRWELVAADQRVDVAYIAGISRLLVGDVEGAAEALHLVAAELDGFPPARRALAQVELARGDLPGARRYIDHSADADRLDRVLAAKLAWRAGSTEEAIDRARQELHASIAADDHPWDVAGCIQQVAQVLCEAGDGEWAEVALRSLPFFLADAPDDLPLLRHIRLLEVGVARLAGDTSGLVGRLDELCAESTGSELAECLRERARVWRMLGETTPASADYRAAVEAFAQAGERWEAAATRAESRL